MVYLYKSLFSHEKWGKAYYLMSDKFKDPELDNKAKEIGLLKKWKQNEGRVEEHYDVMGRYIGISFKLGIREINRKKLIFILEKKRSQ